MTCTLIIVDSFYNDTKLFRLFSYGGTQYAITLLASMINFGTISCQTIAMQNEKPGFVALLGYIGLVYAFLSDTLLFNETFNVMNLAAIAVILTLNLMLIVNKIMG